MVVRSAFEESIVVTEERSPIVGKVYTVELEDLLLYEKVVAYTPFNDSVRLPDGSKVLGKEYDTLPDDIKAMIDGAPVERFVNRDGSEGAERPKYINRLTFVFREPTTDWRFYHSIDLSYPDNAVDSIKSKRWLNRVIGVPITTEDGFKWGDFFKRGDKFTAIVGQDTNSKRKILIPDSITKVERPAVAQQRELSPDAQMMLAYIKENMIGRKLHDLAGLIPSGLNGLYGDDPTEAGQRAMRAWNEIKASGVKFSNDGVTFGF